MKKFLSTFMALTMLTVPFGTNTCMASSYDSNELGMDQLEREVCIKITDETADGTTVESSAIQASENQAGDAAEPKKSSHKLLYATIATTVVGGIVIALNEFSADGKVGEFLGKAMSSTANFAKAKKDQLVEYINRTPVLHDAVEHTKAYFNMTKENLENNISSFKNAYSNVDASTNASATQNKNVNTSTVATPNKNVNASATQNKNANTSTAATPNKSVNGTTVKTPILNRNTNGTTVVTPNKNVNGTTVKTPILNPNRTMLDRG